MGILNGRFPQTL